MGFGLEFIVVCFSGLPVVALPGNSAGGRGNNMICSCIRQWIHRLHSERPVGELAYVNGEFCELSEARVSIEDRGFQFADAVYEGIVAYRGEPFRLPQHLARLRRSADQIRLKLPHEDDEIESIIREGNPALVIDCLSKGLRNCVPKIEVAA